VTLQHPDLIDYVGRVYSITAIDGSDLFDPERYGIRAVWPSTACWRGYIAKCAVVDNNLRLVEVEIGRGHQVDPPDLFGVAATKADHTAIYPGSLLYTGMSGPLGFTGRTLIATDYVHVGRLAVGFAPGWMFETVYDLEFDDDRLVEATDRSAAMADIRERLGTAGLGPYNGMTGEKWNTLAWSRSYEYSAPIV
jgi:hypothetical protein